MPNNSESWGLDTGKALQVAEIERFREELLLPAVSFLSHGVFDHTTVTPGAEWDLQAKVPDIDGVSRFIIEAACSPAWKLEELVAGEILTEVTVTHETMLPFEKGQAIIDQALAEMEPDDESIIKIQQPLNQAATWESRRFIFDNDHEMPFIQERDLEIQCRSGATLWSEAEAGTSQDAILGAEEKALRLMRLSLDAIMTWQEAEFILNALHGLGMPKEILQDYLKKLLS